MTRRDQTPPDMAVVDALCRGFAPPRPPSQAERVEAIRFLAGREFTDGQIAPRVGRSVRTVIRLRAAHGIPGQPVGTNRYTRKNLP